MTPDNVRITNAAGEVDKTADPLFERLVNKQKFVDELPAGAGSMNIKEAVKEEVSGMTGHYRAVVLVNNPDTVYSVPAGYEEGIIVATGDTISFAANASVKANERKVAKLFSEDLQKELPEFAVYFNDYDTFSNHRIGGIRTGDYLTFENWQKN